MLNEVLLNNSAIWFSFLCALCIFIMNYLCVLDRIKAANKIHFNATGFDDLKAFEGFEGFGSVKHETTLILE